ncbi:hypothetical protein [Hydrogenophaga sp. PAMC20947]|uniref:hypothetical protein n=1 Tax=Hydrogenophaga sp. PAMC20947 TaxID=2565558 RepID=UPI00109E2757|nr:hypothetical protein [Hydrogenophaga sp. PAMC20947]QCB47616.1 hypothetical protein E5678_17235 [Hydrogenophaga sp. PAMC20947]
MADRDPVPDWAHTAEASPFTPPASSATPTLLIAAAIVAVGVAGFFGHRAWLEDGTAAQPVPAPVVSPAAPLPDELRTEAMPKERRDEQLRQAMPVQTWTRCQVGEQVVYSDSGCGGGVVQRSSADTQAPVSAVPSMPETPSSHTLYRCKPYSGGAFWSTRHCNQQKALVDRMVTVPRNMTLNQKIAIAERSLNKAQSPVQQVPVSQRAVASTDKQAECSRLDEVIRHIDARARQPQSGQEQDRLRARRQKAHDRRFFLHC